MPHPAFARFGLLTLLLLLVSALALADTPHHYLCRVSISDSGLTLLSARRIDAPMPLKRGAGAKAALRVRLIAPDGSLLHDSGYADPRLLRAEFAPEQSAQPHAAIRREQGVLLLRLPEAPPASRLVVSVREPGDITHKSSEKLLGELRLDLAYQAEMRP